MSVLSNVGKGSPIIIGSEPSRILPPHVNKKQTERQSLAEVKTNSQNITTSIMNAFRGNKTVESNDKETKDILGVTDPNAEQKKTLKHVAENTDDIIALLKQMKGEGNKNNSSLLGMLGKLALLEGILLAMGGVAAAVATATNPQAVKPVLATVKATQMAAQAAKNAKRLKDAVQAADVVAEAAHAAKVAAGTATGAHTATVLSTAAKLKFMASSPQNRAGVKMSALGYGSAGARLLMGDETGAAMETASTALGHSKNFKMKAAAMAIDVASMGRDFYRYKTGASKEDGANLIKNGKNLVNNTTGINLGVDAEGNGGADGSPLPSMDPMKIGAGIGAALMGGRLGMNLISKLRGTPVPPVPTPPLGGTPPPIPRPPTPPLGGTPPPIPGRPPVPPTPPGRGRIARLGEKAASVLSKIPGGAAGLKTGGKMAVKSLPFVGAAMGAYGAVTRTMDGDYKGAALEAVAGLASFVPVIGTTASLSIQAGLAVRDVNKELSKTAETTATGVDALQKSANDSMTATTKTSDALAKSMTVGSEGMFATMRASASNMFSSVSNFLSGLGKGAAAVATAIPIVAIPVAAAKALDNAIDKNASKDPEGKDASNSRWTWDGVARMKNNALEAIGLGPTTGTGSGGGGGGPTADAPKAGKPKPGEPVKTPLKKQYDAEGASANPDRLSWDGLNRMTGRAFGLVHTPDGFLKPGEKNTEAAIKQDTAIKGSILNNQKDNLNNPLNGTTELGIYKNYANLISTGESRNRGYNDYNQGVAWGYKTGKKLDFSSMTLKEVMRRQNLAQNDPNKLFAVGRYQAIPETLAAAVKKLKLTGNELFTPQLQDKIMVGALIPDSVKAYATGKSNDAAAAANATAGVWAAVQQTNGRGRYDKDGVNHASIKANAINQSLKPGSADIAGGGGNGEGGENSLSSTGPAGAGDKSPESVVSNVAKVLADMANSQGARDFVNGLTSSPLTKKYNPMSGSKKTNFGMVKTNEAGVGVFGKGSLYRKAGNVNRSKFTVDHAPGNTNPMSDNRFMAGPDNMGEDIMNIRESKPWSDAKKWANGQLGDASSLYNKMFGDKAPTKPDGIENLIKGLTIGPDGINPLNDKRNLKSSITPIDPKFADAINPLNDTRPIDRFSADTTEKDNIAQLIDQHNLAMSKSKNQAPHVNVNVPQSAPIASLGADARGSTSSSQGLNAPMIVRNPDSIIQQTAIMMMKASISA